MSESETQKQIRSSLPTSSPPSGEVTRLLEIRKEMKSREPDFVRFESWRYVRIHPEWRKPKGIDNHMRLSVKGWPHLVKIGYRGPRKIRGLHPSGYRDVLVHNFEELEKLSPSLDAARLGGGVGKKKKVQLVRRAKELNIRVLNGRGLSITEKTGAEKGSEKENEKQEKNITRKSLISKKVKNSRSKD